MGHHGTAASCAAPSVVPFPFLSLLISPSHSRFLTEHLSSLSRSPSQLGYAPVMKFWQRCLLHPMFMSSYLCTQAVTQIVVVENPRSGILPFSGDITMFGYSVQLRRCFPSFSMSFLRRFTPSSGDTSGWCRQCFQLLLLCFR